MGKHDGKIIKIARGGSNRGKVKNVSWKWSHLGTVLAEPHVLPVTMKELLKLTPNQQNDHKTAGGYFIAAHCDDGRRARANIHFRSVVAFDCDTVPAAFPDLLEQGLTPIHSLEFRAHTTAKSISNRPRVRIYILPDSEIPAEDYGAVSRILAEKLDPAMTTVDPVSFRVAQMMYMPVVTKGGEYWHYHNEGKLLDWKQLLADFGTADDLSTLPQHPDEKDLREVKAKAEDPTTKPGIIGDFCRTYDIFAAIDTFLPDVYTASDVPSTKPRYTYNAGHSANGAEVQDEGLFLYSHHGTDPTCDQLVNSFDLVRIHMFGDLDKGVDPDTQVTKLPSYAKMVTFAQADPEVQALRVADYDDGDVDGFDDDAENAPGEPQEAREPAPEPEGYDDDVMALIGAPRKRGNRPPVVEKLPKPKNKIEELNRKHAIVRIGGSVMIANLPDIRDPSSDVSYSKVSDFALEYRPEKVPFGPNGKDMPLSDYWLEHPLRQSYDKVAFLPGSKPNPRVFNLWRGFSVRPDPQASCQLFLDHIRNIICSGDEETSEYLLSWLADMIQNPQRKPGVAVVLKGLKGAGKDSVHDILRRLFPHNHVKVSHVSELLSQFNGEQERALLLVLEEALWGGERSHGKLQSLITSPTMRIERKGVDSVQRNVFQRLFISSNEKWVVPATADERRYLVLEVSNARLGDEDYFNALYGQIDDEGGLGALLHFLQTRDLSNFKVRRVPQTLALGKQKLEGLKGLDAFWRVCLEDGDVPGDGDWIEDSVRVPTQTLHTRYEDWWRGERGFGHGTKLSAAVFVRELHKMLPWEAKTGQKMKSQKAEGQKIKRENAVVLPPLAACREAFEVYLKTEIDWPDASGPADYDDGDESDGALI